MSKAEYEKRKTDYIQKEFGSLVGRKIVGVRLLTEQECAEMGMEAGYGQAAFILELDDGRAVMPTADPEGNGPGFLFLMDPA